MLKDYGIEGRVIATFVVNKKGKASDVQILRGLDKKIDDEVEKLRNNFTLMMFIKIVGIVRIVGISNIVIEVK